MPGAPAFSRKFGTTLPFPGSSPATGSPRHSGGEPQPLAEILAVALEDGASIEIEFERHQDGALDLAVAGSSMASRLADVIV
ncbi:hypothetical protein V4R08_08900 [Nitrobacter sp. NHB1]|uniref:hypothetical protein n=1 Tax=Nitrobacter sp. NHB1 TaxID=3119830 RepID=UPI002FFF45CF